MSDGITDTMREQKAINDKIFATFEFEDDHTSGDKYLRIGHSILIVWDDAYQYWYIEKDGKEIKVRPKGPGDIDRLIEILL